MHQHLHQMFDRNVARMPWLPLLHSFLIIVGFICRRQGDEILALFFSYPHSTIQQHLFISHLIIEDSHYNQLLLDY